VQAKGLQAARAAGRAMIEAHARVWAGQTKDARAPAQQQAQGRKARGQSLTM
jgi:hypothetical protein